MPESAYYYLWQSPGNAAAVELKLDVVDRLQALIRQTTVFIETDGARRPLETGALLFGRRLESGATAIDDFEEIQSEHQRGASFTLSVADRFRLGHRLRKLEKQGRAVVGYFRIHTRPGMYLDHDDGLAIREFFSQAWQVVLLATPHAGEPSEAGFFFWDGGEMENRQPALPFPLDSQALRAGGYTIVERPLPPTATLREPARNRNWVPLAGAAAAVALAVMFLTTGTPHRTSPRVVAQASAPALPAREVPDTWPAPDEVQKLNAAAIRRARPIAPKMTAVLAESATGSAPPNEESVPKPAPRPTRPEVSLEPVHHSVLHNTIGRIPVLGRLEHQRYEDRDNFVPARPRRERMPAVPLALSRELRRDEPVELRIRIAKDGQVSETELLSRKSDPVFASIAVRAAADWDFEPARMGNKAVPSDMLVHFRFRAPR